MSMQQTPFGFDVSVAAQSLSHYDNHIVRRLSAMRGQYLDQAAYDTLIAKEDRVLYEVFEVSRPHEAGELPNGLSIIHPGRVGREYVMTKGHFHAVLETGEVYYGLKGEGLMVMENPEGDWAVEKLLPGRVVYVPPRWAHRSVNTGTADLVFYWVYPGNAGHNYGTIEQQGFRKLVVEENGQPIVIDNPRWKMKG